MKDELQENFNNVLSKMKVINKPRSLIVDGKFETEFKANGVLYRVMPPDQIFNIDRQVAYHNIETAFALNQTPTSIKRRFIETYNNIIRLMKATGDDWQKTMDKLLRDCLNNVDSFKGELTSRYPAAYYICTLFIIKKDEDLNTWNFEMANEKIDDWVKENLSATDFFGLALAISKELQTILKEQQVDI
jgi:hypothetical protein